MATSWAAVGTNPCAPFWTPMRCSFDGRQLLEKIGKVDSSRTRCVSSAWLSRIFGVELGIWVFPKIGVPPNHPILIGFSIIFTIHFGGKILIFGNIHILQLNQLFWFSFLGESSTPYSIYSLMIKSPNIEGLLQSSPKTNTTLDKHTKRRLCSWLVNVPSPEIRPYKGLINQWFPLIRPY